MLFIILFLHQTTTWSLLTLELLRLFIILFLHQTTTSTPEVQKFIRCLSSCSYIKPQPCSDVNPFQQGCLSSCSYIKPQPLIRSFWPFLRCLSSCSYIKPQPQIGPPQAASGCLSSCSYIKPQQRSACLIYENVVYHLVPTSNHNLGSCAAYFQTLFIILFLHQTTTSSNTDVTRDSLFIILFLHQTTTKNTV